MSQYYTLDGHTVVPCESVTEWAKWFEKNDGLRRVATTIIGKFRVSTVFMGLDRSFADTTSPLLFETMVFRNDNSWDEVYCECCSTWDEAEEQHRKAVAWAGVCAPHTVKGKEPQDEG